MYCTRLHIKQFCLPYDIKSNDTDSALQGILVGKERCSINQLCGHLLPFDKCVKGKQTLQECFTGAFSEATTEAEPNCRDTGKTGLEWAKTEIGKNEVRHVHNSQMEGSFGC